MTIFTVEELLAEATEKTGLSNFGEDNFREGLDHLVAGINQCDRVKPGREDSLRRDLVRLLANRLRWQKDLAEHPQIAEEPLLPPACIVSLPRVGTTKIQRLLAVTDSFQDLPYWQILMPGRIHNSPDFGVEERIAETEVFCNWRVAMEPDIQKTHRITALEPEEDIFLQELGFRSPGLGFIHQSEQFTPWLAEQDVAESYAILKALLQYLQWQFHRDNPKPWLLKSPVNLGREVELERIFPPGMKLICPHREPAEMLTAMCRLIETYSGVYYELPMPREALGGFLLEQLASSMDQHMQWRESNSTVAVLDLSFKEICADSLGTADRIYGFLDLMLTDDQRSDIAGWDSANPQHKDGRISETLDSYGLSPEIINRRFAEYRNQFASYM